MTKRKSLELTTRLGKNIAERRKHIGLTQELLAEQLDVDTETISRFERAVTVPSLATLENLAGKLGVSIASLLEEEDIVPTDDAQIIFLLLSNLKKKERLFFLEIIQMYIEL